MDMDQASAEKKLDLKVVVQDILNTIEREREREIISRRFGLFDRRETLEQIGELLGITRERVRQLEKAVITRLKTSAAKGDFANVTAAQEILVQELHGMGMAARVSDLSAKL